jgi:hypothetical protein
MTIYKLSIVVPGRRDLGGIQNLEQEPKPGDTVVLGNEEYEIIELVELMPARGNFVYLHAICQPRQKDQLV